jgi:hypothetical protein
MATVITQQEEKKLEKQDSLASIPDETGIGIQSAAAYRLLWSVAKMYAGSGLVPEAFKNTNSCAIALNMAQRMGADPLMLMQNVDVIYNRPAFRAKFLIATFNASGSCSKLRYEWKNEGKPQSDDYGCRAYAVEKATGEPIYGPWITWKMVKAEKWDTKNGSKWNSIPELMFMYRAGAWFINTHCPEIAMGLRSTEEEEDIEAAKDITHTAQEISRSVNFPPPSNIPVDPELAKSEKGKDPQKLEASPKPPESATETKPKPSQGPKKNQATATAQQAATYSDSEPDPFAEGGDLFGK